MADAPVVYLPKNSHLLFDLTPRTQATACDNLGVIAECKSACRSNIARFYANYGPRRQIQVDGRYDLLGNYVCNRAKQDFVSGILSAHSQVLDCPAAKMSSAIYWLDDKFYCHQGDFCSQNFPRYTGFGGHYDNCYALKSQLDPNAQQQQTKSGRKCSCLVGTSTQTTLVELEQTMPAQYYNTGYCYDAVSQCQEYCKNIGDQISLPTLGGITPVVEKSLADPFAIQHHINDLICEKMNPQRLTMVNPTFFSQVDDCPSVSTSTISKLYSMRHSSYC